MEQELEVGQLVNWFTNPHIFGIIIKKSKLAYLVYTVYWQNARTTTTCPPECLVAATSRKNRSILFRPLKSLSEILNKIATK